MEKIKVNIFVSGGMVTLVSASDPNVSVVIVDFDDRNDNADGVLHVWKERPVEFPANQITLDDLSPQELQDILNAHN